MAVFCTFDPTSSEVIGLLSLLGFSAEQIEDGNINSAEFLERNANNEQQLSSGFLQALAKYTPEDDITHSENADVWISNDDAAFFSDTLFPGVAFRLQPLFSEDAKKHGVSQLVAQTIFAKILAYYSEDVTTPFYATASVFVDAEHNAIPELDYLTELFTTQDLPLELFNQMMIAEPGVSDFWQDVGRSVLWVQGDYASGSAVVISKKGDLLTAKHVFYNEETGMFNQGLYVTTASGQYEITEDMVIKSYGGSDLVWLQIPELGVYEELQPVVFADPSTLHPGDAMMMVGFAGVGNVNETFAEREYSPGVKMPKHYWERFSKTVEMQALILPGDSGGAGFNEFGELAIIVTSSYYNEIKGAGEPIPQSLFEIFEGS